MKVCYFICAALLCTASWGHCISLSKQDMQNAAVLGNLSQKVAANLYMQNDVVSGNSITLRNEAIFNENQSQPDVKISTTSFKDSSPLNKIGMAFVQPTEPQSAKSSPEPGTIFLLGMGMAGMIFITRQRIKR